jgi:hypothetical protein
MITGTTEITSASCSIANLGSDMMYAWGITRRNAFAEVLKYAFALHFFYGVDIKTGPVTPDFVMGNVHAGRYKKGQQAAMA